jgi:hypothetical protein
MTMKKSVGSGSKPYRCPHCGEKWVGVTNRVASRPLKPDAVAFANQHASNTCSFLKEPGTGKERRINMSDEDYLCRRKWMDVYLSYLEKGEKEQPPTPPPNPCDPVSKCPDTNAPPPPEVPCAITLMYATCEHSSSSHRTAEPGQIIDVVPGTTHGPDDIDLIAFVQNRCGKHPTWTITGQPDMRGTEARFPAMAPEIAKKWIPVVHPEVYSVACSCCNGSTSSLEVHAYPPNELATILELNQAFELILQGIEALQKAANKSGLVKWEWEKFKGRIEAKAHWKEYDDLRAYYYYSISVAL